MYSRSHRSENIPAKRERQFISRIFKPSKPVQAIPPIPVELWIHIISYVSIGNGIHYQNVDHTNFSRYRRRLLNPWSIIQEIKSSKKDYNSITLVCKTWHSIARPGSELMLHTGHEPLPVGIETLVIAGLPYPASFINQVARTPGTAFQLTTLVIDSNWNPPQNKRLELPTPNTQLQILISHSKLFPALRCLSLEQPRGFGTFWELLRFAFRGLVSLTVRKELRGDGIVLFDKLEILDIQWREGMMYRCKSLRHCSFHGAVYSPLFVSFLQGHGEGLESLILEVPYSNRGDLRLYKQDTFWCYLPNLRTFGFSLDPLSWAQFDIPERDSLSHLYLTLEAAVRYFRQITIDQVRAKIQKMHWIKFIGISERSFSKREHDYLEKFCKGLGVVYSRVPD